MVHVLPLNCVESWCANRETLRITVFIHEKAVIVPWIYFYANCLLCLLLFKNPIKFIVVSDAPYCMSEQYEIMQYQNESVMCIYFILIFFVHFSLTSWQQKQLQAPWKHHWGQMVSPQFCMQVSLSGPFLAVFLMRINTVYRAWQDDGG